MRVKRISGEYKISALKLSHTLIDELCIITIVNMVKERNENEVNIINCAQLRQKRAVKRSPFND